MNSAASNDSDWHTKPQYRIRIRDLRVRVFVGIHDREYQRQQAIRINLELVVHRSHTAAIAGVTIADVLDYDEIIAGLRHLAGARHYPLLENLGEEFLAFCMGKPLVDRAYVTIEKLEIDSMAAGIGVEMTADRQK